MSNSLDLENAIIVLNKHKYEDHDDWRLAPNSTEGWVLCGQGKLHGIHLRSKFEAIAIAEKLVRDSVAVITEVYKDAAGRGY